MAPLASISNWRRAGWELGRIRILQEVMRSSGTNDQPHQCSITTYAISETISDAIEADISDVDHKDR